MKKALITFSTILVFSILGCASSKQVETVIEQDAKKTTTFHISQYVPRIIYPIKNNYLIEKRPFQILFEGLDKDDVVYIYASTDENLHRNYNFLIRSELIFGDGDMFAGENNPSQQSLLVVGSNEKGFNSFADHRRFYKNNITEIFFNGIIFVRTNTSNFIYLIIYIDKYSLAYMNQNTMIEEDKISYLY